jgi:hypothetical protein
MGITLLRPGPRGQRERRRQMRNGVVMTTLDTVVRQSIDQSLARVAFADGIGARSLTPLGDQCS